MTNIKQISDKIMTNITISEYGYIGCDNKPVSGNFVSHRDLTSEVFKELYDFWDKDENTQKIFTRENQHCLKATSYVGVIQTQNLSIEILPKIYENSNDESKIRDKIRDNIRAIFIQMLKPLLNINEIQINKSNLSSTKNKNIYEMFIALFTQHMDALIFKGLKSEYMQKDDNQNFLKGKLKFNEHIKQNYIRKERFYVEFDEYMSDRVENRLLKSTISLLLRKTKDSQNKKVLRRQLFIFDEVKLSKDYDSDISRINLHRGMEHYDMPLRFAKLFLRHESFTSLRGKDNVFALLFPMERVFEGYIEFVLRASKDILGVKEVLVNGGKGEYLLTNGSCNMARLQPDYLLKMKIGKDIVTDAKWKLLEATHNESQDCDSVNISSGDVYQAFSYLHFYDARDTAYLFVPQYADMKKMKFDYQNTYSTSLNKHIEIIPVNLQAILNRSPREILEKDIFTNKAIEYKSL